MELLSEIRTTRHEIDVGVATTEAERAEIIAQRFRVYQRHGYYAAGLTVDLDEHDRRAVHFLAMLRSGRQTGVIVGSARLIRGESGAGFRLPGEEAVRFDVPEAVRAIPVRQRAEVSRLVSEACGAIRGGLLIPLGLVHAISVYSLHHDVRCGINPIRRRLLRALHGAGLPFHEIPGGELIYPRDGMLSGYYYDHPEPVAVAYWLVEEILSPLERALSRYEDRRSPARLRIAHARGTGLPVRP